MANALRMLDIESGERWRDWLAAHHDSEAEVWLIFHKRHTGRPSISYEAAIDEALCFGWVDSLIKRIDDARYARKFTPRKADSSWSESNIRRYERLLAAGRLADPGRIRPPTDRIARAPRPSVTKLPAYIVRALKARPAAQKYFDNLAPSHKRRYLGWIDSAKKQETKEKRLKEAMAMLAAGRKPGLK
jgi:uncharacterized protein YdeI (YjbR/CyaY-like superfamily)